MQYNKPPISFSDQTARLKERGLGFHNISLAEKCLSNISYYRLRAYTYPFQDNDDPNHPFIVKVNFEDIIDLYKFDRKLSQIVFEALEKIEVALRTQIIYQWAITYGSHWQTIASLYRDPVKFATQLSSLQTEIDRSNETFIEHYKKTYTSPTEPPSWMSLEVSSFGLLSQIFYNLRKGPQKSAVAKHFGLNDISILENWMHCFSNIRNICAHHARLWNRRLTAHVKLPTNPLNTFIKNNHIYPYKLYAALCCIQYMLDNIQENCFKSKLLSIMGECPLAQEKEMGFPIDWKNEIFWKQKE
jgi:abortive infection bacteriophage resistance protein